MQIKLFADGKLNNIGVNREKVRLSVKTEGIDNVKSVEFKIYKSLVDASNDNAFAKKSESGYYAYFDGELFSDLTEYFFKAVIYCKHGVFESEIGKFETGLSSENFSAKWICEYEYSGQVAQFRKTFNVENCPIKARLYVVGLGFYKSFINDKKTDEQYFKPVLTDFDLRTGLNNIHYDEENFSVGQKTVCYDVIDVSSLIKKGENTLEVLLGTGWYCNEDKLITDPSFTYGKPKLIFELHLQYEKTKEIIISDQSCWVRKTNIRSQLFEGDTIDFTRAPERFANAELAIAPKAKLIVNQTDNDVVREEILPLRKTLKNGVLELDFGKNHTGGLCFTVKGKKGSKLVVKHFENKKNGKLNAKSSRWEAYKAGETIVGYLDQENNYVLSGSEDYILPYFHWNCYRYVTIESDAEFEIREIKSLFICTSVQKDSYFNCNEQIFNRLYEAFCLTQLDNMHCGVPSDCPHREKLPYTGDGQLVCESVMNIYDAENFYRKWLDDIIASQGKNGFVPYTAPFIAGGGGYWWSNAIVVVPLILYNLTGDKEPLERALNACLKLVEHFAHNHDGDYLIKKSYVNWCLGDWLTPEVTVCNATLINTIAAFYAVANTIKICEILDRSDKTEYLFEIREKFKKAINQNFLDKKNLNYADGVQGENVLPVLFDIVPKEYKFEMIKKIVRHYSENPYFDTGIVITPKLLDLLTDSGNEEVALKLMMQKDAPSYFDMIKNETTLPEHWFKHWPGVPNSDVSHCHPMYGSVIAWLIKRVAGLDLSTLYKKEIAFKPCFIKTIKSACARKDTQYGQVSIEYTAGKELNMNIEIPFGIQGIIELPKLIKHTINGKAIEMQLGQAIKLGGGKYNIRGEII